MCKYIQDIINNQQKDISQKVHTVGFRKRGVWTVRSNKVQLRSDIVLGTCPLNHCPSYKYCLLPKTSVPVPASPASAVRQEEIGTFALSKAYHLKLLVFTLC